MIVDNRRGALNIAGVQAGYSLVELLIVVAIIGAISLVAVPNFMSMMRTSRMKTSLRQFNTDLRAIRARSITENHPTKISFTTGGTGTRTYRMFDGTMDPPSGVITWDALPLRTKQLDETVYFNSSTFTDEDSDGTKDVVFRSNGTVTNIPSGNNFGVVRLRTDSDIPIPSYEVRVNLTGRIEVN